jgi:transcriptional regulator with XRE-family HTH domain
MTLQAVTKETGLGPDRLSRFETGERVMRYEALQSLARFFGVTIDQLLEEDNDDETGS